jgi:hypothetical protein
MRRDGHESATRSKHASDFGDRAREIVKVPVHERCDGSFNRFIAHRESSNISADYRGAFPGEAELIG